MRYLVLLALSLPIVACVTQDPPKVASLKLHWATPCPTSLFRDEIDTIGVEVLMGDYAEMEMVSCSEGWMLVPVPEGDCSVIVKGLDYLSLSDTYEERTWRYFDIQVEKDQDVDLGFVDVARLPD